MSSLLAHTEHAVAVAEPVRPLYYLLCCLSAFERNIDFMVRHFSQDHSTVSGTDNLLLTIPMLQLSSKKTLPMCLSLCCLLLVKWTHYISAAID